MGGWKLKLMLGTGVAGVAAQPFQIAHAQSLDEAILAAIGRGDLSAGFSPSYCAGFGGKNLIDLDTVDSGQITEVRNQFGANLARICAPFGNTIGGSSLGSGNIYSLTSSRTVSQRRASVVRQEQSTPGSDARRRRDQNSSKANTNFRPYYQLASLGGETLGFSLDQGEVAEDNFLSAIWVEALFDTYERKNSGFTNGYQADSKVGRAGFAVHYIPWEFSVSIEGFSGRVEGEFDGQGNTISEGKILAAFGRDIRIELDPEFANAQFSALPTGSFGNVCLISEETGFEVDESGAVITLVKGLGSFDVGAEFGSSKHKSSYDRTACVVRGEGASSPQVTYHGARIGGVAEVQETFLGLNITKPLSFHSLVLAPRVSTKYSNIRYPEYEEVGREGVFRRVTSSLEVREDASQAVQVTDIRTNFSASGLELVFLEHRTESWISSAGLSGTLSLPAGWGDVSIQGNASFNYEANGKQQRRLFHFREDLRPDPTVFSFQTDRPDRDWVEYNLGVSLGFNSGVRPFVSVSGVANHDYFSGWGATAGISKFF